MENRFKLADGYINTLSPNIDLYNNIWSANTTSLLHAPRKVDKTTLAVDIALSLTAREMTVFYLTTNRFNAAINAKIKGNCRLYVHKSEFSSPDDPADYADIVIKDIEEAITTTGAKVFIIDSLTRIAALSFGRNAAPAFIMKRLVALQVRHKISILVIAHDTTPAATRALVNLADSEIIISEPSDHPADKDDNKNKKDKKDIRDTAKKKEAPSEPTPRQTQVHNPNWDIASYHDNDFPFWRD